MNGHCTGYITQPGGASNHLGSSYRLPGEAGLSFEFRGLARVRARGACARGNVESAFRALPELPARALARSLKGLCAARAKAVLRRGWLEVDGPSPPAAEAGLPPCAAVNPEAAAWALRRGRKVLWRIDEGDFRRAVAAAAGAQIVQDAAFGLARERPQASALWRLTAAQGTALTGLAAGLGAMALAAPQMAGAGFFFFQMVLFLAIAALRLQAIVTPRPRPRRQRLAEAELPVYSLLVPVYREVRILPQLVGALGRLNYPAQKLDILIVCEDDDEGVLRALEGMELPGHFHVLRVPQAGPRTKPKALNHALAFARGELLTIYDAEDIPEPNQLRMAAEAFAAARPEVACLQARLAWYNAGESWISRMMAIEYATHFEAVLPTMARMAMPLPLGGTSNHFRVAALRAVGGWDPHNVTEDADLGFRLARSGWRAGVLPSTTWEESCVTWRAWRAQRARWIKGWLQTWLVQMRAPRRFWRETGWRGAFSLHALLGAGVFAALAHPFFVAWTIWQIVWPGATGGLLWHVETSASATVLAAGYGAAMACGALGLHRRGMLGLWPWLLALPAWWLAISVAAWMALWDFLTRPHHWRKTEHGVSAFLRGG